MATSNVPSRRTTGPQWSARSPPSISTPSISTGGDASSTSCDEPGARLLGGAAGAGDFAGSTAVVHRAFTERQEAVTSAMRTVRLDSNDQRDDPDAMTGSATSSIRCRRPLPPTNGAQRREDLPHSWPHTTQHSRSRKLAAALVAAVALGGSGIAASASAAAELPVFDLEPVAGEARRFRRDLPRRVLRRGDRRFRGHQRRSRHRVRRRRLEQEPLRPAAEPRRLRRHRRVVKAED